MVQNTTAETSKISIIIMGFILDIMELKHGYIVMIMIGMLNLYLNSIKSFSFFLMNLE